MDFIILGLGFASLLVFLLDVTSSLPGAERTILFAVDMALVGLYAAIFAFKWLVALEPGAWFRRHAFLLLGLHPLTLPLIVAERYFIVVQVIVLVLRLGKALDQAFGERILGGLFDRYRSMVVEELTDPLLLRLAIVLEDAVVGQDYAAAIGRRLDQRRDLVENAVKRAIEASPKLSRLNKLGPVHRWVDETTHEVVDAAHAALTGPEINLLIREGLEDAFAELKDGIVARKWTRKGVGVRDLAMGVVTRPGSDEAGPG